MSQVTTGSVSVTSGSASIVGSGTDWATSVTAGSIFTIASSGVPYVIGAVADDTHATLTSVYAGSTASGQAYRITTSFTPTRGLPYPEHGDLDTATILKRAMLILDQSFVEPDIGEATGSSLDLGSGALIAGKIQLPSATGDLTWGGAYGAGIPTISGSTSGGGSLTFYPTGSTGTGIMSLSSPGLSVTGSLSASYTEADVLTVKRNGGTDANTTIKFQGASTSYFIGRNATGGLGFSYNSADVTNEADMTLDASGNLLVGATSSISGGGTARCEIVTGNDDGLWIKNTEYNSAPLVTWNATTSGDPLFVYFGTEGTVTGRGTIDWNRASPAMRLNTTSDKTLKTRIGPAPVQKSLDILNGTVLEEYYWNDDETKKPQIGPFAQDLYEVFKGAVSVGGEYEETDADGNTVTKYRPWGVDKTAHIFHLVAGWQEHQRIIQELTARLEALEAKCATL